MENRDGVKETERKQSVKVDVLVSVCYVVPQDRFVYKPSPNEANPIVACANPKLLLYCSPVTVTQCTDAPGSDRQGCNAGLPDAGSSAAHSRDETKRRTRLGNVKRMKESEERMKLLGATRPTNVRDKYPPDTASCTADATYCDAVAQKHLVASSGSRTPHQEHQHYWQQKPAFWRTGKTLHSDPRPQHASPSEPLTYNNPGFLACRVDPAPEGSLL